MKKNLSIPIGLLVSLCVGCGQNHNAADAASDPSARPLSQIRLVANDACGIIVNERTLHYGDPVGDDQNVYCYEEDEVKDGKENFKAYFKTGDGHDLETPIEQLSIANIKKMMEDIRKPEYGYDIVNCYAAVKMTYGMVGKRVIMIYTPVILRDMYAPTTYDEYVIYTKQSYTAYNGWNPINQTDSGRFVEAFTGNAANIQITHHSETTSDIEKFINEDWPDGDTRSCIIPLQEIMDMYMDNNGQPCNDQDIVKFEIIANNHFSTTGGSVENYKIHTVVYNSKLGLPGADPKRFEGLAVDFAQMCPPRCLNVNVGYYGNATVLSSKKKAARIKAKSKK
jgi:hypothetical protein